jgi:tetratricopeptide (TPR) repeat protein
VGTTGCQSPDEQGHFRLAVPLLERGLESAQQWELAFMLPGLKASLAYAYVMSERLTDASPLLDDVLRTLESPLQFGCEVLRVLGEASCVMGRFDYARECGSRALQITREGGRRGVEARALHLLAKVAAHTRRADLEAAEATFQKALALAETLEMRPLVARCHLGLGKLYRRTGQREKAREDLTTATAMFREMDMGFWLQQAEAEMRQLA